MKFLTLFVLCCVAKNINSATTFKITIGAYLKDAQQKINAAVAEQNKKAAAAGSTVTVKAPNVPTPANPNQVITNPAVIPLGNPKCDLKGLTEFLKALIAKIKGSCSNVKKNRGPLKKQCEDAKANFKAECNEATLKKVTQNISYEFKDCSAVVDPKIKDFTSKANDLLDTVTAATSGTDTKKCGKDINKALKELILAFKALLDATNSVTGYAKPPAGSNAADAVATSDVFLGSMAQVCKTLLDMTISVSSESSVELGEIAKKFSDLLEALIKKTDGGTKINGSVSIEISLNLTITSKCESSVDMDELKEECSKNETDLDEAIKPASDIEVADDDEEGEDETDKPSGGIPTDPSGGTPTDPSGGTPTNPSGGTSTDPSGEKPTDPSGETPTDPSGGTPEEKPTAKDCLDKISLAIKVSFESLTKTCGKLKTDAPAMDGKFDGSMNKASASISGILKLLQSSDTASVTELSTNMDAGVADVVSSITELVTSSNAVLESLSKDDSVAGKTAVDALKLILETIVSLLFKVVKSISTFCDKLKLFLPVQMDAIIEAVGKIDVKSADFTAVATDLTKITKDLNAESCKKVVEDLGKSSKDAVGKIKTKFSAKFGLRISRIIESFSYTSRKVKAPKVTDGITKIKGSFDGLTKEIGNACDCAKKSKENASGEGSGEKGKKCKSIAPDSSKSVLEVLLIILKASKDAEADTTLDAASLEIFKLIVKQFLTTIADTLTGLSTTLTEQTTDTSVSIKLGSEVLTKATSGGEIDCEKLAKDVKDLSVYSNAVDTATPALDSVKEVETKMSAPAAEGETKDTKAILSEGSSCASSALTTLSTSTSSFSEYFSKPVDPVAKAQTKISAGIEKFIKGVTGTSDATTCLKEFLIEICSSIEALTTAYSDCAANTKTELDPKGHNAMSGLKFSYTSTVTITNSIFTCFKAYQGDIPADLSEFFGSVCDAVKAAASNPDAVPSELGGKVKDSCDKYKAKGGA